MGHGTWDGGVGGVAREASDQATGLKRVPRKPGPPRQQACRHQDGRTLSPAHEAARYHSKLWAEPLGVFSPPLSQRDVPLYIRSRAERYIRSGRAAVIEWADARIAFQVQGLDVYLVGLVREADALVISCTCRYFVDRGPCKHVWAAAVLVDQDPRWDGSWLQGDPLIDFESGIYDSDLDADIIDAGDEPGPEFLPERAHRRGAWVPPVPSACRQPRARRANSPTR